MTRFQRLKFHQLAPAGIEETNRHYRDPFRAATFAFDFIPVNPATVS